MALGLNYRICRHPIHRENWGTMSRNGAHIIDTVPRNRHREKTKHMKANGSVHTHNIKGFESHLQPSESCVNCLSEAEVSPKRLSVRFTTQMSNNVHIDWF